MAIEYSKICRTDESLRSYQQEAKSAIFSAWDKVDNVMFQMPTGTGKTRLFSSIISDINQQSILEKRPVRIVVVAHRTELIDQIDKSLHHYKIPHGIIAGNHERHLNYPVQVASIQTITNKHNLSVTEKLKADYVIIDEAHHALAKTYQMLWSLYPTAKRLGVTATPWRMSGCGFTDLFDVLITSWTVKKFIENKYLSNYQYYSLRSNSSINKKIDGIRDFTIDGDYKTSALEQVMNTCQIRAQLLDSYQTLAAGKKGIIYAISQAHSKLICEEYSAAGYRVVSIDSKTPKEERLDLVSKFKKSEIDIIVNVDIFSEGFDCPDIEFVQLARPTRSLAKYLQQVGRALRYIEGKPSAIILDNVGMYSRFGLPDARRHWKHHFVGNNSSTEDIVQNVKRLGDGVGRIVDLKEGHESMVLIQQTSDVLGEEEDVKVVVRTHKIGPIKYPSGFVWKDPKHVFKDGVHYYTDCTGQKFCMYPDADSNWHFEIYLEQYKDLRYMLIPPTTPLMHSSTAFSLECNIARLQGEDLLYVGLDNGLHSDFAVMDFYDPHVSGKSPLVYFADSGDQIEDESERFEMESSRKAPHLYKKPEDCDGSPSFIDRFFENLVPIVVPNTTPVALVQYEIRFLSDCLKVVAIMNDGSTVTTTKVNLDSDLAKTCFALDKDGYTCEVFGYLFSHKMQKRLMIYTNSAKAEDSILSFDETGAFFDDEKSKAIPKEQPKAQPKTKAKKKKKEPDHRSLHHKHHYDKPINTNREVPEHVAPEPKKRKRVRFRRTDI